jgi:cell division protein FtsL
MSRTPPANHMLIGQLSEQIQNLREKIEKQNEEIELLKNEILNLTQGKIYEV